MNYKLMDTEKSCFFNLRIKTIILVEVVEKSNKMKEIPTHSCKISIRTLGMGLGLGTILTVALEWCVYAIIDFREQ